MRLTILTLLCVLTGCTTFKRDVTGFKYRNGVFSKQFQSAEYEHVEFNGSNYYRVKVEGYKSDAAQTIEAAGKVLQLLMKISPVPIP